MGGVSVGFEEPNHYIKIGCFTKYPINAPVNLVVCIGFLKYHQILGVCIGCLGYQVKTLAFHG